ncbi:hypothetical protein JCGZ_04072 [Jatropha curcas]|uniref:Uncharacterized protein n=1 Tax=Jatropha curcas TaxID=180498 RepID=A0A067L3T9_JATCU|nr:hypothetical protein JCGZ_04072 [Jatropha curcas]
MNSIYTLPYTSSPHYFFTKWLSKFPQNSFSVKRRRSLNSRRNKTFKSSDISTRRSLSYDTTSDQRSLKLVLDVDQISYLTSSKLHRFLSLTEDAYYDLKTLITVDQNNRIVFSCRRSTIQFTGAVLLCGFVAVSAIRLLINLGLGIRSRFRASNQNVVVRRDRSLGGREVVVGTRVNERQEVKRQSSGALDTPLSPPSWAFGSELGKDDWRSYRVRREEKLPKWWPVSVATDQDLVVNKEEYQREANRLIRAITDYRTSGRDVTAYDIIQLRRICRTSGVHVSFDTTNTRDAVYRASVNYVLDLCSSDPSYYALNQIDGEDAQHFIVGLAKNIGLENIRAARMVSAAVAARTRSCFLQAWALEVQGKHSEAALELSKICLVLQTFPPEESSPEMEMVARGLAKHLKLEQRERLMNMFISVCSEESHRSAADALGLMLSPRGVGDQQEGKHT